MAFISSAALFEFKEEELNNHTQQLQHSPEGATSVMASSPPAGAASQRRKRNNPGNPSPDAEVVALSPNSLMVTNRFLCEVCNKGFKREQNLQLHRRGHDLPWKLKHKTNHDVRKKVYICPEVSCIHHEPSRALGDLSGIKKHFFRKHGEKNFSCGKCNKKYAVYCDWKAHHKICGTKDYKCECGSTFSRRDSFMYHRSFCEGLTNEEVVRHTTNHSSYSSKAVSILANASNPGMPAGSLIQGSHQQLSSPLFGLGSSRPNSYTSLLSGQSAGSAFQSIQPPNRSLQPVPEPKLKYPIDSDLSGIKDFSSCTGLTNMFNLGFNGGDDLKSPQNDLDLDINSSSFSGLMMNAEASAYNILNRTPSAQFSATAVPHTEKLTGASSNNLALNKSIRSSLSGGMEFNSAYGGALGDGMTDCRRAGGSTFQEMFNNLNAGGGGTRGYRGGMEYSCDKMNAPYGEMMYNVNNAHGMVVGQVNSNAPHVVVPQMIVPSEYSDVPTRDFLGMGNEMNNMTGGGMVDDHRGNGIRSNSPNSEATTSTEAWPFVHGLNRGF